MSGRQFAENRMYLGYTKDGFCKAMRMGVPTLMKYEDADLVPIIHEMCMRYLLIERAEVNRLAAEKKLKSCFRCNTIQRPQEPHNAHQPSKGRLLRGA